MIRPIALCCIAFLVLTGCPQTTKPPPLPGSGRCEVDLAGSGLFSSVGSGATAKRIEDETELIGGDQAQGTLDDFLLSNDKIRVVIQRPGRQLAPLPYGGTIIDADRIRSAGQPGQDQLGELGLFYALGRAVRVSSVEVLEDGARGGMAIIAATGEDALNDVVNLPDALAEPLGGTDLSALPNQALPLLITTYYLLSPGESRVRMLTAFCNQGRDPIVTAVGDLVSPGPSLELFNPSSCSQRVGSRGCAVDPSPWFGLQGDDLAYGFRSYALGDPTTPEASNALIRAQGLIGWVAAGEDANGLRTWAQPQGQRGALGIHGESSRTYLRDFLVGRELGEFRSFVTHQEAAPKGRLRVSVTRPDGSPAGGARIAVGSASSSTPVAVLVADDAGRARVDLPATGYRLTAAVRDGVVGSPVDVQVATSGSTDASLTIGETRRLTIEVRDPFGQPLSAKATVICPGGACPPSGSPMGALFDVEPRPANVATIAFIPPSGSVGLDLPLGSYELVVTRGPEYSAWPDTWPNQGEAVNLTASDQSRTAVLGQVVDSAEWRSVELSAQPIANHDQPVPWAIRLASLSAEGVELVVSAQSDQGAVLGSGAGAPTHLASLVGITLAPFDYGHHQVFPLPATAEPFDWAGGEEPTLRPPQLYASLRERFPDAVIQLSHPRSAQVGLLTRLKVNTATGASLAAPAQFRMTPADHASTSDTGLFSADFDALEVQWGPQPSAAALNDWMTFLSRGWVKAATASAGRGPLLFSGTAHTYVQMGDDLSSALDVASFTRAIRQRQVIGTNGPWVSVSARRLDPNGQPVGPSTSVGDTLSLDASNGDQVQLKVKVQAPEWLTFEAIEIYTHAPGRASTDGAPLHLWPQPHQSRTLEPSSLPVSSVPGMNGLNLRRIQVEETFVLTPAVDTWYAVAVRGGAQSRPLFPLAIGALQCTGTLCTAEEVKAFAFTNALLVDADNSGSYDRPPLP